MDQQVHREMDELIHPFLQKLRGYQGDKTTLNGGVKWVDFYTDVFNEAVRKINSKLAELEAGGRLSREEGIKLAREFKYKLALLGTRR